MLSGCENIPAKTIPVKVPKQNIPKPANILIPPHYIFKIPINVNTNQIINNTISIDVNIIDFFINIIS